jgi:hypothetical protein
MKEHEARSGQRISTGSFYRELGRLLADGLVRTIASPPDGDPRRTPYVVTEEGAALFDAWFRRRPGEPSSSEDDLAARGVFLRDTDPASVHQMLSDWEETLWLRSKILERQRKAVLKALQESGASELASPALLISRRLAHVSADIEFLEKLSKAYGQWLVEQERAAAPGRSVDRRRRAARR